MGIVVLFLVAGGIFSLLHQTQRDFVRQRDVNRALDVLRTAEISIVEVLRQAGSDPFDTGEGLLDPDPLNHGAFDNLRVKSDFNPADADFDDPLEDVAFWVAGDTLYVRWESGGDAEALAHPVESLTFEYFSMNGTPITTAAMVGWAKSVRVTLGADRGTRSAVEDWRQTWVDLRNRRY